VDEFRLWSERDTVKAEKWATDEAKLLGFSLDASSARALVARVGVDQWLLFQALQKLAVTDTVTPVVIEEIIEANPLENIFNLFDAALRGNAVKVKRMLETLELTEDPFRLFGLLAGQAFQLVALAVSEKPEVEVAKDFGAHPFALSKLAPHAKKLGRPGAKQVIITFAEADEVMKTGGEPWLLIERALTKIANLR
jgi:DNA polymerase III delta subunit